MYIKNKNNIRNNINKTYIWSNTDMPKKYFTTGEVAELYDVTRDAVLKWVKNGRISAVITPGGHCRIPMSGIPSDQIMRGEAKREKPKIEEYRYCWNFNWTCDEKSTQCHECIIYKSRAKRCFEISHLLKDKGFLGIYCHHSCEECEYYKMVMRMESEAKSDNSII